MMTKKISLIILSITLVGCSLIHDRSDEYQSSTSFSPLTMPPGLHCDQIGDELNIPNTTGSFHQTSELPPDSIAEKVAAGKLSKQALQQREKDIRDAKIIWTKSNRPIAFQGTGKALVGKSEGVYTKYMTELESHEQRSQNLKGDGYTLPALLTTEALPNALAHVERALKDLRNTYPIKHKDNELAIVYLYDITGTQGKFTRNTPLYQLKLIEQENGTLITLATHECESVPTQQVAQKLLTQLDQALKRTKESISLKKWLFD